ncbi:hypothetical protein QJS04_geneDACA021963 [Acorus gramineus]|uniref:Uncharacterized protein n=1 Tax=Acorus gramineus TaxID=55184 RepID=A0AAV9AB37_ACOGR|nr:hypothetical protein QJS04_geneDACA021963 [Acorus gramineus]
MLMDVEEETTEKARARKAAGEESSLESPVKKPKVDQMTPISTSDHSGGRRDDPEIIESKRPMQEVPLLQRFTKIAELQMEQERRKKDLHSGMHDEIKPLTLPEHPSDTEIKRWTATITSPDETDDDEETMRTRKAADEASSSKSPMNVDQTGIDDEEINPLIFRKHRSMPESHRLMVMVTTRDEMNRPLIQLQPVPVVSQNWTDDDGAPLVSDQTVRNAEPAERNQNDGAPADQTVGNAEDTEDLALNLDSFLMLSSAEDQKQPRNTE